MPGDFAADFQEGVEEGILCAGEEGAGREVSRLGRDLRGLPEVLPISGDAAPLDARHEEK